MRTSDMPRWSDYHHHHGFSQPGRDSVADLLQARKASPWCQALPARASLLDRCQCDCDARTWPFAYAHRCMPIQVARAG